MSYTVYPCRAARLTQFTPKAPNPISDGDEVTHSAILVLRRPFCDDHRPFVNTSAADGVDFEFLEGMV